MTDFWFIFGTATIDPGLLDKIGNPGFKRISLTLQEGLDDGTVQWMYMPSAGYLLDPDTTNVRTALRDNFAKPYGDTAPIISLYTAGKVCQLWNTFQSGLKKGVSDAHEIFQNAAKATGLKPPYSPRIAVLLGACLIDDKLCDVLKKPEGKPYANEFGFNPDNPTPEWQTIQKFIADTKLYKVQTALLSGASWRPQCSQKLLWYAEFKRAAN